MVMEVLHIYAYLWGRRRERFRTAGAASQTMTCTAVNVLYERKATGQSQNKTTSTNKQGQKNWDDKLTEAKRRTKNMTEQQFQQAMSLSQPDLMMWGLMSLDVGLKYLREK